VRRAGAHLALGLALAPCLVPASAPAAEPERPRTERAAQLFLDDVFAPASKERTVELSVRALSLGREPVTELRASDFLVREDDSRIDSDDVEVSLLEDAKRGVACVLAIDLSPTMRDSFAEVKAAAIGFLERLGSYDRVAVLSFAGSVEEVAGFTASRAEARRAIDALQVKQEPAPTRVFDALDQAVELVRRGQAELPRRSFVLAFSDGNDGGSERSLEEVLERAKGGALDPRVLIFSVGYATGFGESGLESLRRIAEGTTAETVRATPGRPPTDFYGAVWRQMTKAYVLRFRSRLDGEAHRVLVVADGQAKDERTARYAAVGGSPWPWLAGGVGALAVAGAGAALLLLRRAGQLVFQGGPERGKRVPLRRGLNRIGQTPDNDVVLPFDTISRRHAEIEVTAGGQVVIRDLDSTNGTWVNDKPLEEQSPLRAGDRIRFADVELVYQR
jgi:hypothetical protein